MADILDKRPVDAEMTIFKTEVEPNKLNACIDNILMRVDRLETKFADVQPLSVVAEHIKNRLYETALNTNGAESDTIAAMAERIDFWIDELKDGDTNG